MGKRKLRYLGRIHKRYRQRVRRLEREYLEKEFVDNHYLHTTRNLLNKMKLAKSGLAKKNLTQQEIKLLYSEFEKTKELLRDYLKLIQHPQLEDFRRMELFDGPKRYFPEAPRNEIGYVEYCLEKFKIN